jgi:hypothetical protein
MSASRDADQSFAVWMRWVANGTCPGRAPHDGDYAAANAASVTASQAKQQFVTVWNPIAAMYAYPRLGEPDL